MGDLRKGAEPARHVTGCRRLTRVPTWGGAACGASQEAAARATPVRTNLPRVMVVEVKRGPAWA